MQNVYFQTYSLGSVMHGDFIGSMKRIAALGYSGVEFAGGYGGLTADEMKILLAETGLDAICSHVGIEKTPGDIDFLAAIGARYIVCPMAGGISGDYNSVMRFAEELNRVGKLCAAAGLKYGYHNHTQEFCVVNDRYFLDYIIENTDPAYVITELDVGWCAAAGVDPVEYINKHAGRFELIHAKETDTVIGVGPFVDFDAIRKMNAPQGKGIVDWKRVKEAADAQGCKAYIVEREWDYAGDIWQCVSSDLAFMKTL